jgi:hypothetical protein
MTVFEKVREAIQANRLLDMQIQFYHPPSIRVDLWFAGWNTSLEELGTCVYERNGNFKCTKVIVETIV